MNWSKMLKSFKFAFNGLYILIRKENNFKFHALVACSVVILGFAIKISIVEWLFLVIQIAIVFAAEAFNTAMEELCNFVENKQNPKIGLIKDVSAGGVLISVISAIVVGLIIFLPKLYSIYETASR